MEGQVFGGEGSGEEEQVEVVDEDDFFAWER